MPTKRSRSSQSNYRSESHKRSTQFNTDRSSRSHNVRNSYRTQSYRDQSSLHEHEKPVLRFSAHINEIRSRNKVSIKERDINSTPLNKSIKRSSVSNRQSSATSQYRKPQKPTVVKQNSAPKHIKSSFPAAKTQNKNAAASSRRSKVIRGNASHTRPEMSPVAKRNMGGHIWDQTKQTRKRSNSFTKTSTKREHTPRSLSSHAVSGNNSDRVRGASALHNVNAKRHFPIRIFASIIALILVLGIANGIDSLLNGTKIYQGVSIGEVNVSGLTKDEAIQAVSSYYSPRVSNSVATFYSSREAQQNPTTAENTENIEEQISYEESLESRTQWTIPSSALEATFNIESVVDQAFQIGRENGGLLARIQASLNGWNLIPECTYNETTVSETLKEMTASIGSERVNYNIEMNDEGIASVTSGHDGNEVVRDWLISRLNETYFGSQNETNYVLETQYMPLQITEDIARACADKVNASLAAGAVFSYEGQSWSATKTDLASWITTDVVQTGDTWDLKPVFNEATAKKTLLSSLQSNIVQENLQVTFNQDEQGSITVSSNATGTVPLVTAAISNMNETFFVKESRTEAPVIELSSTELPSTVSFDDAIDFGLISEISSFTTQYSSGAEARTNNIHTVADLLSNSIIKANGGSWSFNDTAGEATEDKGYQDAGAIVGGEYSDAIGGGICQVATTVFNAIYDAGYPVTERHNHTLRIESYPEGRDAAIAYPYMDLAWQNDSTSDVLLVMSYTNSSVTCTLWGVDPNYNVSTDYGDWEEGEPYSVRYKSDDTIKEGTEYVETTGVNGSSISITRIVKDSDGKLLHEDLFESTYAPKDQVVVRGTA